MTKYYIVKIANNGDEITAFGIYSTKEKAHRAIVDWVEGSPISPSGVKFDNLVVPDDWYLEPTAFGFATDQLNCNGFRWSVRECPPRGHEVDGPLE